MATGDGMTTSVSRSSSAEGREHRGAVDDELGGPHEPVAECPRVASGDVEEGAHGAELCSIPTVLNDAISCFEELTGFDARIDNGELPRHELGDRNAPANSVSPWQNRILHDKHIGCAHGEDRSDIIAGKPVVDGSHDVDR